MRFLNFINKCFIIWLIIHNITTVKKWPYKCCKNCNKSLSWKFTGEVSLLCEYCNWVFIKIHANMLLNGSLGDWYIIEMYGRIILFCIFPCKNNFLCLFWGIWVKRHFPCVGPITNFIEIIVKLWCWIILILNNGRVMCHQ